MFAGTFAQYLDVPAPRLRVARVHAEQVAGEYRRFVAAGARTNFEKDVAVVEGILRHEQALQLQFLGRGARHELGEFLVQVQFPGDRDVSFQRGELPVAVD